ncbi:serine (or cysteine) proteinase inhibitor, clade E, member 2, isoform CRA_b [Rattus norvegicus]|uniref:Serine (Or cysteine) proteinase inhibitor, clade E, member 2, isoform CRA_b n=1 Tax=Rattus norvegicus TaxID=10116 RepID=A6JW82_RAT|nr:serine (or cysteine) proteinase inhibitor, clade E, member 2, isoform CRA_b [Rattus norvegicus]
MNWHFPFFILTTVTLSSVYSQLNSLSLEELGSDTGIQVFNQIIKSQPHENVVISPHGIASILGMLQLGADGRTKKQLSTVMRYNVNGMIDNLLSPNLIDSALTKLVLVNAVYFKGLWKSRFQPENTKKRTFVAGDGKSYQVPMLAQLSVFRSGSTKTPNGLWYNFIELPYHGESISMLIALPTESSTPLSAIIPHISTKTINSWMNTMVPKRMQLVLPKFTAVAQTDLKEPLKALGITEMFEPSKANFAKITRSESLHVSHILQKAKIEVSEDGTKAAVVTTAILIARSSPPWFIVDRPFLFCIRHNPTGAILFLGQVNKP